MNTWKPRTEILAATHRWYWMVASFLLGALLGWLVGFIWPAPYRATLDLYVGLNAYRAPRDAYIAEIAQEEFRNLDDYKNWQMGQLNSLAFSDEFLGETLIRLQAEDEFWQNTDMPALRSMLSIGWRNTGDWHFGAQAGDVQRAKQAVDIWAQVVLEKTALAVSAARQMVIVDSELNAFSRALTMAETRQRILTETQAILLAWQSDLTAHPVDQSLVSRDHWSLLAQATVAADWNDGWVAVLATVPDLGALPATYLDWLSQINALIEAELALLPQEIAALQAQHADLAVDYVRFVDQSRALSANIEVAKIKDQAPQTTHLQPRATLMLVGGSLGLLVLLFFWLIKISWKNGDNG